MIPTSDPLKKWLLHVMGQQELKPKKGRRRLTEAVGLNREAQKIIPTFGCKEFRAIVGFIDMQGFSKKAQGIAVWDRIVFLNYRKAA
jgi:hypothetical protein